MTTTHDLIQAIAAGDAMNIETAFNAAMAEKVAGKLDDMRLDISQNMFTTQTELDLEPANVDPAPQE